jgi:hypothetical protein
MKPKTTAFPRRNPQPKALTKPTTRSAQPKQSPGKSASGLRRLLVAVDFSKPSLAALDAAAALARPSGSSLTLLHVAPTQPYPSDMGYIPRTCWCWNSGLCSASSRSWSPWQNSGFRRH